MMPRAERSSFRGQAARLLLVASLLLLPKCLFCLGAWLGLGLLVGPELCGEDTAVPAWAYPVAAAVLLLGALALRHPASASP